MSNPYVNKVAQSNGTTLIDISDTTAVASDVASGKYFYLATGQKVEGTASGGGGSTLISKSITSNGTYNASSDNADGYSSVTVNVSGSVSYTTLVNGTYNIQTSGSTHYIFISNYAESMTADETYRVTWGGTTYLCTTKADSSGTAYGGYYIGNLGAGGGTQEESGEPFLIYRYNAQSLIGTTQQSSGTVTFKLEKQVSSGSAPMLTTKNITANGTYNASDDSADGYSSVTVNVPSSGASSWTKVAETSYQVSTTNTSVTTVATWATGSSDLWTSSKWVYVRIRDMAGKREGYFYGCDQFFCNKEPINGTSSTYTDAAMNLYIRYSASGFGVGINTMVSFHGVYADRLYSNGDLRIRSRYHSSNTLTIDGTYKVEVYLLDPAGGVPIFE